MISREQEKRDQIASLIKLGNECNKKGDHQTALLLYKKVTAYENDPQLTSEEYGMLADTYHNLGNIYAGTKDWKNAQDAYERSIKILYRGRNNDKPFSGAEYNQLATIHHVLASIYAGENDTANAAQNYVRALSAEEKARLGDNALKILIAADFTNCLASWRRNWQEVGDSEYRDFSTYHRVLSRTYYQLSNIPQALEHIKRAQELRGKINPANLKDDDYRELTKYFYIAAMVDRYNNNFLSAVKNSCDCLDAIKQIQNKRAGDLSATETAYKQLAELYAPYEKFYNRMDEVTKIRATLFPKPVEAPPPVKVTAEPAPSLSSSVTLFNPPAQEPARAAAPAPRRSRRAK